MRRRLRTEQGFDREGWKKLNQEMGLTAVHIPEAYGGGGFGYGELGIVLEEMGRNLLCAPFFSTAVLATTAIVNAGTEEQKKALLPGIAAGDVTATFAFSEDSGLNDAASVAMTATALGGTYKLDGTKSFVLDGHTADLIVVLARKPGSKGEDGLSFFTVDGKASGLERRLLKTMDETRKLARLTFKGVEARPLGAEGTAAAPFAKTLQLATVALAAEQVGGAERCLELAVAYAKERVQFGRPIGSFQAIKHKCADMLVRVEAARSASYYAACAADERGSDLAVAASLAKAYCSDAYFQTPPTACRCMAASASPGTTTCTSVSSAPSRARSLFGDATHHRETMMRKNWGAGT